MVGFGNILKPSEVVLSGSGGGSQVPVYLDLNTTAISNVKIRTLNYSNIGDNTSLYITDNGTISGNPLFNNLYSAQICVINTMNNLLTACSVTINSNSQVTITVINIINGNAGVTDLNLLLIGD